MTRAWAAWPQCCRDWTGPMIAPGTSSGSQEEAAAHLTAPPLAALALQTLP